MEFPLLPPHFEDVVVVVGVVGAVHLSLQGKNHLLPFPSHGERHPFVQEEHQDLFVVVPSRLLLSVRPEEEHPLVQEEHQTEEEEHHNEPFLTRQVLPNRLSQPIQII